jgi:hypothetical protein
MATAAKKTGNGRVTPSKRAQGAPSSPTQASSWKKGTVGGTLVVVPSGNTALIRTPGMQAFLTEGVIPNGLMPIIQEAMLSGAAPSEDSLAPMMNDPEKIKQIMELADAITVSCCMDPKVTPAPTMKIDGKDVPLPFDHPDRDENTLYVDEVDFNDKMFIFNVAVGGTADLEKFRTQS